MCRHGEPEFLMWRIIFITFSRILPRSFLKIRFIVWSLVAGAASSVMMKRFPRFVAESYVLCYRQSLQFMAETCAISIQSKPAIYGWNLCHPHSTRGRNLWLRPASSPFDQRPPLNLLKNELTKSKISRKPVEITEISTVSIVFWYKKIGILSVVLMEYQQSLRLKENWCSTFCYYGIKFAIQ